MDIENLTNETQQPEDEPFARVLELLSEHGYLGATGQSRKWPQGTTLKILNAATSTGRSRAYLQSGAFAPVGALLRELALLPPEPEQKRKSNQHCTFILHREWKYERRPDP